MKNKLAEGLLLALNRRPYVFQHEGLVLRPLMAYIQELRVEYALRNSPGYRVRSALEETSGMVA